MHEVGVSSSQVACPGATPSKLHRITFLELLGRFPNLSLSFGLIWDW